MRFIVRDGTDPVAGADRTMLAAMGMAAGGVLRIGSTAVLVRPRTVGEPTALELGPQAMANAGLASGSAADATRIMLPQAVRVATPPLEAFTLSVRSQNVQVTSPVRLYFIRCCNKVRSELIQVATVM